MSELTIFKASAGSGKTYRLVLEYLKLVVKEPYMYRHILAVTFTIKATAEMKQRIIRDLHKVVNGADENLLNTLAAETNIQPNVIQLNARKALSLILHDYDSFSINTIDSFFQRVLRSFARDVGLYGAYEVDLDQDALLMEATDRLLDSIEEDAELRNWLMEMTEDQLADGKSWQIKSKIYRLGKYIDNVFLQEYIHANTDILTEREQLKKMKNEVFKIKSSYEKNLREVGKKGLLIIEQHGLQLTDFSGGKRSFINYFKYCTELDKKAHNPTATLLKSIDDIEKWYTKKTDTELKNQITNAFNQGLNDLLKEAVQLYENDFSRYNTAIQIIQNLHALGVVSILVAKIREIGKERNTMLLSEGNQILHKIIDDNDTPFIYEKTGSYYYHYMIDEFQDTSSNQWDNFKPLIHNSVAQEGTYDMIVGDIKQSIYRWRNSDWRLLKEKVRDDLYPFKVIEKELDKNWRSSYEVVQFNNLFFSRISDEIQNYLNDTFAQNEKFLNSNKGVDTIVSEIYSDVLQAPQKTDLNGYVQLKFLDKTKNSESNYAETVYSSIVEDVENLQVKGAEAKDIAILVRTKSHGNDIAGALLNKRNNEPVKGVVYDVISDDSLTLDGSIAVRFIILFFRFLMNTKDQLMQKSLIHFYSKYILNKLNQIGQLPPKILYDNDANELFLAEGLPEDTCFSFQVEKDYFPFFNEQKASVIIDNWLNLPPLQLVDEIETNYGLRLLTGEQANLQAFKDAIHQFTQRDTVSLQKITDWWEEKGNKLSIQTNSERNAIRIMTIHKSKGLEFEHVLIPFCDWSFTPKSGSLIWCSTKNSIFTQFPILPIGFNESLAKSEFFEAYLQELLFSYIDNMNLLYVAFTRAVKSLFIYSEKISRINDYKSVGKLLNKVVPEMTNDLNDFSEKDDGLLFELGEVRVGQHESKEENTIQLSTSLKKNCLIQDSLIIKKNYDGMLEDSDSGQFRLNRGKIIHELLSGIELKTDLNSALQLNINKGIIVKNEADLLREKVEELLMNENAENWFDGSYRVWNERSVIGANKKLYRPDRVMTNGNKAIVVDYKNSDIEKDSYKKQVDNYVEILKSMGYVHTEGFVWYLKSNKIIQVC